MTARRAEALGLAPDFFPAQGGASRAEVAAALRQAVARADSGSDRDRAEDWLARFVEEYPEEADTAPAGGVVWLGGGGGARYDRARGRLAPARGIFSARQDPTPIADDSYGSVTLRGGLGVTDRASAWAAMEAREDHLEATAWEVVGRVGKGAISVGRAPVGYGESESGLVLGSPVGLPRVEFRSAGAWSLGGVLRPLGRMTVHTFLTRLDEPRHPTTPWLWGARVALRPHGRVTIGLNRASIFGGDSFAVTPGRVAGMLVGVIRHEFENQVVSLDARYRLPTERVAPLVVYGEWAAEDGAGAIDEQPALVGGLELPGFAGAMNLTVGGEIAYFAACCGHGAWYNHAEFTGHWVSRDIPLGHPLGGEGTELALIVSAEALQSRVRLRARGFHRDRSEESLDQHSGGGNLFARTRAGSSHGATVGASARLGAHLEAEVRAAGERGEGWRETIVQLELRSLF